MWKFVIVAVLVIGAGTIGAWWWTAAEPGAAQVPDFALQDLSGTVRHPSDWRGKVLLLNFWATWCAPCRREVPMLVAAQHKYGSRGLRIVGMAVDRRAPVKRFARKYHVDYPLLADPAKAVQVQDAVHGGAGLPFTLIVDRNGRIRHRVLGRLTHDRLAALITPLLAQKTNAE